MAPCYQPLDRVAQRGEIQLAKRREAMGRRSSLRDPAHRNHVRRNKPGRYVRNDGWGGAALCRT